jgi:hypothetical protein
VGKHRLEIFLLLFDVYRPLISELLLSSFVPLGIFSGLSAVAGGKSPNYAGYGGLLPFPHADTDISAPPHLKKEKRKTHFHVTFMMTHV